MLDSRLVCDVVTEIFYFDFKRFDLGFMNHMSQHVSANRQYYVAIMSWQIDNTKRRDFDEYCKEFDSFVG